MSITPVDELLNRLKEAWAKLHPLQRSMLVRTATAMTHAPLLVKDPGSALLNDDQFREVLTNRLVAHHANHTEPLTKLSFEYAFVEACNAAGWSASRGKSATFPGADIVVDGVGVSLKTQADNNIKYGSIHISKLRESASMKGKSGQSDYLWFVQSTLLPHLQSYDRVLMLRAFSQTRIASLRGGRPATIIGSDAISHAEATGCDVIYQLVEIPIALLRRVGTLIATDFAIVGTKGSARALVSTDTGQPAFELFFDGSDDKIQIQKLNIAYCTVHGTWSIPLPK
ncbi:MAG: hypothetical protein QM692_13030 [Thermomicrobiales bacterium]